MRAEVCMRIRKAWLFVLSLILPAVLSSCMVRVNWFDSYFYAPWWAVAVPVIVSSVIIVAVAYAWCVRQTYRCPNCGTDIRPRWNEFYVCIHLNGERVVRCPVCGRKGFCRRVRK